MTSTMRAQNPAGTSSAVARRVRAARSIRRPSPSDSAARRSGASVQAATLSPSGPVPTAVTMPLVAAAQAEDRQEERREEDLDADDHQRGGEHGEALIGELAEATLDPREHDHGGHPQPEHQRR